MKKTFLLCLFLVSKYSYSQSTPPAFLNESMEKEVRIITCPDTITDLIRYDISFVLKIADTSTVDRIQCNFYKLVLINGVESDSVISSVNINIKNISTSAYNSFNNQSYFMESNKLFFILRDMEILANRRISISAYNMETLRKKETYNLDF
jgi:hypothetical protein